VFIAHAKGEASARPALPLRPETRAAAARKASRRRQAAQKEIEQERRALIAIDPL
jgi:hypothetical protein